MVIIGIVGRPGSGKTEFSRFLTKSWDFEANELPFIDYRALLKENKEFNQSILDEFVKKNPSFAEKAMEICKNKLLDFQKNQVIFPIYSMEQVKFMR